MRALVVEDDPVVARAIGRMLNGPGYSVDVTACGEEAVELAKLYDYDVVILDRMLPDLSGLEVLKRLRAAKIPAPVLILSGIADPQSKAEGLDLGASDYLTKPFQKAELLARINAIVRRAKGLAHSVIKVGQIAVDLHARTVEADGKPVRLTRTEYAIVELLALRKGAPVTKEMLLDHIYGVGGEAEPKVVDGFMYKVRKKLAEATGGRDYIETAWGRGYVLRDPEDATDRPPHSEDRTSVGPTLGPAAIHSVLVVEDDTLLAMDLAHTLADAGYEVLGPVTTSKAALTMAEAVKPDIALVDINLRDGARAGIDAAREMVRRCGTPCLFVSGNRGEALKNRDAALGLLEKPFSPDAALASISAIDALIAGETPRQAPRELELFHWPARDRSPD